MQIKSLFSTETINFLYWLICKPLGIIAISSNTFQKGGKILNYNLGDDLNFYLLKDLSGKRIMNYNNMRKFRLQIKHYVCIGSVFEWRVNTSSYVWGTGSIYGGTKKISAPQKIYAVRGPLTRKVLLDKGISCPEVYGDQALLTPLVYSPKVTKKYKIGIIPHFIDYNLKSVKDFCTNHKNEVCVIQMQNYKNWKNVIEEICSCESIVSSSLHGLILSDAYNIPNTWMRLSDKVIGGDFKFQDYFASVGRHEEEPLDFRNKDINIEDICLRIKNYHSIKINIPLLIESCPFIKEKRKKELIRRSLNSYPKKEFV